LSVFLVVFSCASSIRTLEARRLLSAAAALQLASAIFIANVPLDAL
jgi:hypothetical protein